MTKPKPSARDHYEREKARRATKVEPENELMAAARKEYQALLAAQATKGKGGRPKKTAAKPVADADDIEAADVELENE